MNMIMIEIGFLCRGEIIWDKGASVGTSCVWGSWCSPSNPSLRDVHEYILIYSKGEYRHDKTNEPDTATISPEEFTSYTKSIWQMQTASAKKLKHPAPYPLELPTRLIRLYSYRNDVILDTFVGCVTTAVACINENRNYIGIELNAAFYGICAANVANAMMDRNKLF
jgi:site-specific DNA-methyltransferase (adenine-specific)